MLKSEPLEGRHVRVAGCVARVRERNAVHVSRGGDTLKRGHRAVPGRASVATLQREMLKSEPIEGRHVRIAGCVVRVPERNVVRVNRDGDTLKRGHRAVPGRANVATLQSGTLHEARDVCPSSKFQVSSSKSGRVARRVREGIVFMRKGTETTKRTTGENQSGADDGWLGLFKGGIRGKGRSESAFPRKTACFWGGNDAMCYKQALYARVYASTLPRPPSTLVRHHSPSFAFIRLYSPFGGKLFLRPKRPQRSREGREGCGWDSSIGGAVLAA
jgi:hypothetical protein